MGGIVTQKPVCVNGLQAVWPCQFATGCGIPYTLLWVENYSSRRCSISASASSRAMAAGSHAATITSMRPLVP